MARAVLYFSLTLFLSYRYISGHLLLSVALDCLRVGGNSLLGFKEWLGGGWLGWVCLRIGSVVRAHALFFYLSDAYFAGGSRRFRTHMFPYDSTGLNG